MPPAPIFIVGFPRSGTTLLDTLLMNMPDLHVLEEMPVLREVEAAIAGDDRPRRSWTRRRRRGCARTISRRSTRSSPPAPGQIVVDKHPLHMARMPLVHRLFPDARIIFVERHPCDAVLSCFMANFKLNHAMRSFTDLEEAARTYDAVFDAWTRAEALLPLNVHRVRYERMVEDLEGEMRPLLDFLGLPWDEEVLDNRAARGDARPCPHRQLFAGHRADLHARRRPLGALPGRRWRRCCRSSRPGPSGWATRRSRRRLRRRGRLRRSSPATRPGPRAMSSWPGSAGRRGTRRPSPARSRRASPPRRRHSPCGASYLASLMYGRAARGDPRGGGARAGGGRRASAVRSRRGGRL